MRNKGMMAFVVTVGLLLTSGDFLSGHHSRGGYYSARDKQITLRGTVKQFSFTNPHAFFRLDVTDAAGKVTTWTIELGSPGNLIGGNRGWSSNVLKPGDKITVSTLPAIDGRPSALDAAIQFEDGRKLSDGLPFPQ
jgi:hypothetical protein